MVYLDIWHFAKLFDKMGSAIQELYSSKDRKWAEEIKDDLKTVAKKHIYFEFLRLEWTDKLEQAEKKAFKTS